MLASPQPRRGWRGPLGWVLLGAEGSVLGHGGVSLQRENQTKKGCSLFFTSPSQQRNPNLPQDLFGPGSRQETFTLRVALINLGTFSFSQEDKHGLRYALRQ